MPTPLVLQKNLKEESKFAKFFRDEQLFWASVVLITLFFSSSMYFFVWKRFHSTEVRFIPLVRSYDKAILLSREALARRELLIQSAKEISTISWNQLHFFLPGEPELPRLILELVSLSSRNGFTLEALRFGGGSETGLPRSTFSKSSSQLVATPVSFEITLRGPSGFSPFLRLFQGILSSLRFLNITNFSYVPGSERYTLALHGFYYEPSEDIILEAARKDPSHLVGLMQKIFSDERFLSLKTFGQEERILIPEKVYVSSNGPENDLLLRAQDPGTGESILLSWVQGEGEGKEIHIFRSLTPSTPGREIAEVSSGVSYYIDREVEVGRPYYYRLSVEDASGVRSEKTAPVVGFANDQTPPSLPEEIRVESNASDKIILSWKNPLDEDFAGVNVYRTQDEKILGSVVGRNILNERFEDLLHEPQVTYYYFFSSLDTHGNESRIVPLKELVGKSSPFE